MSGKFKPKSIWASTPFTCRGEHAYISGDPKGKNFLYVNGNNIFIRDIENPHICDVFIEHSYPTTCAKYSPSGFYVASGDNRGNLLIWDTVNPEHLVSKQYQPIAGRIRDVAWTEDSKRLVLVGEGRDTFGAAIMVDTGTSVGKIDNLNKVANSCDVKPNRPYRAIAGADDFKVCFYEGPPFKYKSKIDKHSRFVLSTRFSPDGSLFSTAGGDGMCFLFDGKTGEYKSALGGESAAHKGSVYGVSWSGDSKQILTVSGDKTAKIWDVETGKAVTQFVMGTAVEDQQMACLWQNNNLLTVSLSGNINYLNPADPSKPLRVLKGHQKPIKSLAINKDKSKIFSGSFDGATNAYDFGSGTVESVEGNKAKFITQMGCCEDEDEIDTIGADDTFRTFDVNTMQYKEESCALDSQPQAVARGAGNVSIVAGIEKITVIRNGQKASVLEVPFKATAVSIHPNKTEVAVGAENGKVHVYTLSGDNLTEKTTFQAHSAEITTCRFSPDGEYLAAGSTSKAVDIYRVQNDYEALKHTTFKHHTKIMDVAWSPNSRFYASAAMDGSVYVWDVSKENPLIKQKNVHGRQELSCVQWVDDKTIATGGGDCCIRISSLEL